MVRCAICHIKLKNSQALVEHIKSQHIGKLSKQSVDYLLSQGIPAEELAKLGVRIGQLSLAIFEEVEA
jgi:hypothetical protein